MTIHNEQERIAAALELLTPDLWVITPVQGMGIIATRQWSDESEDTVLVLSPESTYARRHDAAKRLMWQLKGSIEVVLRAVEDLPPPGSPGAPRDPVPRQPADWTV